MKKLLKENEKVNLKVSCLGSDCPERKSICCGGISTVKLMQDGQSFEGYACSKCGKEFQGGKCRAEERIAKEPPFRGDLSEFHHGEEGTHYACARRIKAEGGLSKCCGCNPHDGCENA